MLYIVRDYWSGLDLIRTEDKQTAIEYAKSQEGTEVIYNNTPIFWNIELPF